MTGIAAAVEAALSELEGELGPIDYATVSARLRAATGTWQPVVADLPTRVLAELMAFDLVARYEHEDSGWGGYYGPQQARRSTAGEWLTWPSLNLITAEVIEHWAARATACSHPVLRARYADLVWEFSPRVLHSGGGIESARALIDATLESVTEALVEQPVEARVLLERALGVARGVKDQERLTAVVAEILRLEQDTAELPRLGTWGYAFDLLIENKKISLDDQQQADVIGRLEQMLEKGAATPTSDEPPVAPFAVEHAARRLARHYRRTGDRAEMERVLRVHATTFEGAARVTSALQGTALLQRVYDTLTSFEFHDEAARVAIVMREIGSGVRAELQVASHEFVITDAEMEQYVSAIVAKDEDVTVVRIASTYVPDKATAEQRMRDVAKGSPLLSMIGASVVDGEGRQVARAGSIDDDPAGRLMLAVGQQVQLESVFLHAALRGWIQAHGVTVDGLLQRLLASPVFSEDRSQILSRGLQAYMDGDHIAALHVLVPQIEVAVRTLLKLQGRNTYKPGRDGSVHLRLLDDMLRDDGVVSALGDNAVYYLKSLLTDQRGWNIRNNVCHGLVDLGGQDWQLTDRVVHVLLLLSLLRPDNDDHASDDRT